jgi:hypothetical protein
MAEQTVRLLDGLDCEARTDAGHSGIRGWTERS